MLTKSPRLSLYYNLDKKSRLHIDKLHLVRKDNLKGPGSPPKTLSPYKEKKYVRKYAS